MNLRTLATSFFCLALGACAPPTAGQQSAPLCEVGTGADQFVPLADGDTVTIVTGPQGGYHIYTSVRQRGLDAAMPQVEVTVRLASNDVYLGPGYTISPPLASVDGWDQVVGLLNFVTDPTLARGQQVVLRALVRDGSGNQCVAERTVIAQ